MQVCRDKIEADNRYIDFRTAYLVWIHLVGGIFLIAHRAYYSDVNQVIAKRKVMRIFRQYFHSNPVTLSIPMSLRN